MTLSALLFRAVLSTAAPRPLPGQVHRGHRVRQAGHVASTTPPVTMSATPNRCPTAVAATSMTVLATTTATSAPAAPTRRARCPGVA